MNQRIHNRFHQMLAGRRRAKGHVGSVLPEALVLRSTIQARNQFDETVSVPPGTFVHSVSLSTTDPGTLYVSVVDQGTRRSILTNQVRGRALFPTAAQMFFSKPLLILEPGLLQVTLKNTGSAAQDAELVLFLEVPTYELVSAA